MRNLIGTVVSVGSAQTAIVRVDRVKEHPLYRKKYQVSRRLAVHDPESQARLGARVRIAETRPISRTKHFILSEVLTEAIAGPGARAETPKEEKAAALERTASESAESREEDSSR
jgi:small subunit ribosomal protein S17